MVPLPLLGLRTITVVERCWSVFRAPKLNSQPKLLTLLIELAMALNWQQVCTHNPRLEDALLFAVSRFFSVLIFFFLKIGLFSLEFAALLCTTLDASSFLAPSSAYLLVATMFGALMPSSRSTRSTPPASGTSSPERLFGSLALLTALCGPSSFLPR